MNENQCCLLFIKVYIFKKILTFEPKYGIIIKLINNMFSASFANVAQLVEQRIRNAQVTGSSPVISCFFKAAYTAAFVIFRA